MCESLVSSNNHVHNNNLHFHPEEPALGYEFMGLVFDSAIFQKTLLEKFFQAMLGTSMAKEIVRAKGIFRAETGAIIIELASGQLDSQTVKDTSQSKISIIGKGLNRKEIEKHLTECIQSNY